MSIFLFPGQGSQQPEMGKDFLEASPEASEVFKKATEILGNDFLDTLLNGDAETLNHTRVAQPALVTVEVAIAHHLAAKGITPTICTGHSLGEISALVVAGVCTFKDALSFTRERARLMSENVPEGGMVAVLGLDAGAIEAVLPEGVQVANYNSPQQTVISGATAGLEAAAASLKAAGARRVLPLKVSGPFHSALMRSAAEEFAKILEKVSFSKPGCTFVSSVTGKSENDPDNIRRLLAEQLYSPVRWVAVMQVLGSQAALEIGPGNVLKGLAKRIDGAPEVQCVGTLQEAEALYGTL